MENIKIRPVALNDSDRLLEIYSYYVRETAVSFELEPPSAEEFAERVRRISSHFPYLVAEENGRLLGYAYANIFKDRAAYDKCVEVTIYLDKDERGRGLGRMLYVALETALAERGITNLYSCIGVPVSGETGFRIDRASERCHHRMGYDICGEFHKCGYKFGHYYSMIWMEKFLPPAAAE